MICDLANPDDRKHLTNPPPDICIIGAGAAGLAMAHSLIDNTSKAKKVVVLEASRRNDVGSVIKGETHHRYEDHDIQPIYDGIMVESDGITEIAQEGKTSREFFLHSRIKAYGGTTNCWEGWTRPLNAVDFGNSGDPFARWPIKAKNDLVGVTRGDYYQRAMNYCSLGKWSFPYAYDQLDYWPTQARATKSDDLALMPGLDPYLQSQAVVQIGSPPKEKNLPRDFGWAFQLRWGPEIGNAKNVFLFRNANVRNLIYTSGTTYGVQAMTVKDGPKPGDLVTVGAQNYILAASCVENVRLLLHSKYAPALPLLGKYLMTHPLIVQAAYFQAAAGVPPEVSRFAGGSTIKDPDFPPTVFAMLAPTDKLMRGEFEPHLNKRIGDFRAWVQFPEHADGWGTVNLCWEQKPAAENQIALDPLANDRLFGDPLPRVNLALGKMDWDTREVALWAVGKVLMEGNKYAKQYSPTANWPKLTGEHALGGTRMADDISHGVVDSDCQVFKMQNTYIAGGSVFPTGGWANPTLTIIALALRLADHLKKK